jgi:hypothetical protein
MQQKISFNHALNSIYSVNSLQKLTQNHQVSLVAGHITQLPLPINPLMLKLVMVTNGEPSVPK